MHSLQIICWPDKDGSGEVERHPETAPNPPSQRDEKFFIPEENRATTAPSVRDKFLKDYIKAFWMYILDWDIFVTKIMYIFWVIEKPFLQTGIIIVIDGFQSSLMMQRKIFAWKQGWIPGGLW